MNLDRSDQGTGGGLQDNLGQLGQSLARGSVYLKE